MKTKILFFFLTTMMLSSCIVLLEDVPRSRYNDHMMMRNPYDDYLYRGQGLWYSNPNGYSRGHRGPTDYEKFRYEGWR